MGGLSLLSSGLGNITLGGTISWTVRFCCWLAVTTELENRTISDSLSGFCSSRLGKCTNVGKHNSKTTDLNDIIGLSEFGDVGVDVDVAGVAASGE